MKKWKPGSEVDLSDITKLKCDSSIPDPSVLLSPCCPGKSVPAGQWEGSALGLLNLHSMKTRMEGEICHLLPYYLYKPHRWQSLKTRGCHFLPKNRSAPALTTWLSCFAMKGEKWGGYWHIESPLLSFSKVMENCSSVWTPLFTLGQILRRLTAALRMFSRDSRPALLSARPR